MRGFFVFYKRFRRFRAPSPQHFNGLIPFSQLSLGRRDAYPFSF
jgi:hypothetical protein